MVDFEKLASLFLLVLFFVFTIFFTVMCFANWATPREWFETGYWLKNPGKVFGYSISFSLLISVSITLLIWIFEPDLDFDFLLPF